MCSDVTFAFRGVWTVVVSRRRLKFVGKSPDQLRRWRDHSPPAGEHLGSKTIVVVRTRARDDYFVTARSDDVIIGPRLVHSFNRSN